MKKIKNISVQQWLPIEEILSNGIIKINKNKYVKILKIIPINYNLKSQLEKEAILNSYKLFLKNCNFDFQILIQSSRKNLDEHILKIKENSQYEKNIKNIANKYIENIQKVNQMSQSEEKEFFIIIAQKKEKNNEEIIIEQLNNKFLKIKDFLSRCGNNIFEITEENEIIKIIKNK